MPPEPPEPAGLPDATVEAIAARLRDAERIVVLTGAGISTESGIPDFRGPQGIWTKDPKAEKLAHISHYLADPEVRVRAWQHRLESGMWAASPNAAHHALVDLEQSVGLDALVTQNVDGLHQAAGSSPELVVEIHGTVHEVTCLTCEWNGPMADTLERVRAGESDPSCLDCGGILKSATISFGQQLVPAVLERAQEAAARAEVMLALGTSLGVYPAAALPEITLANGGGLVVMNAEPTPFDELAEAVVREPLGAALPPIIEAASRNRPRQALR